MSSSNMAPPSSLLNRTAVTPSLLRRRNAVSVFSSPASFPRSTKLSIPSLRLSSSLTHSHLHLSWFSPSPPNPEAEAFNGWEVVELPPLTVKKKGPTFLIGGTCVATLVAAVAYLSLSRKGFRLQFPWQGLHGVINPIETTDGETEHEDENAVLSEASSDFVPDSTIQTPTSEKLGRVKVSIPVDSAQLEALSVLETLKIIEEDVRADELCTKREYARWLVRLNSLLERNPKHRIVPSISLSGSMITAFNDVNVDDPDFEFIQALAESGIIPSKLSGINSCSDSSEGDGSVYFYPERFISRQDLIGWKAQLEYEPFMGEIEQMSRTAIDYMDLKEISSDVSPELFIDMLAGDKSIIRKVFGRSKRFQPNKPATKAQSAVALTSGRMMEAISNEILRLDADNSSRQAAVEEIRFELIDKGDIQRFWDEKMNEERTHGFEVEELFISTLKDLEEEKILQVKTSVESLKEKAAMDCQRQLLFRLKEEVDEMSERLASERTMYVAEQSNLLKLLGELQMNEEGMLDTKCILEAEVEALRILRSWVEDEARKSQARAKVLEEVRRRWEFDN